MYFFPAACVSVFTFLLKQTRLSSLFDSVFTATVKETESESQLHEPDSEAIPAKFCMRHVA